MAKRKGKPAWLGEVKRSRSGLASLGSVKGSPMILFSCNPGEEKRTRRDMREWIVTLTDQYDTTTIEQSNKLSVEDQLKKEVGQLKEQIEYISCLDIGGGAKSLVAFKLETGCPVGPLDLCEAIMKDVKDGNTRSRHCTRMLPFQNTCLSKVEDIKKCLKPLIESRFNDSMKGKSFAISYHRRFDLDIRRGDVIDAVIEVVKSCFHDPNDIPKVDLNNPDVTIMVDITMNIAGVAVFDKYDKKTSFVIRS